MFVSNARRQFNVNCFISFYFIVLILIQCLFTKLQVKGHSSNEGPSTEKSLSVLHQDFISLLFEYFKVLHTKSTSINQTNDDAEKMYSKPIRLNKKVSYQTSTVKKFE